MTNQVQNPNDEPAEPSVHDNFVYAYVVNCEGKRVILHTAYRDRQPHEFTDVIFRDVLVHHFDHAQQGNILFDVQEVDIARLVKDNEQLLSGSWRYGWPPVQYDGDLSKLVEVLRAGSVRAYSIDSSYGLTGWVLARSCERVSRAEPAMVG